MLNNCYVLCYNQAIIKEKDMSFTTILDHVTFIFDDEVHDGQFTEQQRGLIWLANQGKDFHQDTNLSRPARIVQVGPDVKFLKEGDHVIIELYKWTPGFKVDGKEYWRTEEQYVIAHIDD